MVSFTKRQLLPPPPRVRAARTHGIGGWVGKAGMDTGEEENLLPVPGIESRLLGCQAFSIVTL